jgi:acetyl esterase/lipase
VLPAAAERLTVPYDVDPDLIAYAASMNAPPRTPAPRDDWRTLREQAEAGLSLLDASLPEHSEVARVDHTTTAADGTHLLVRWYDPSPHRERGPGVLFLHGGGMILGSVAMYDRLVAGYVAEAGVPFLSVDYRVAPEHPHPTPVEDCFAGLQWLVEHAEELRVDPARIAVMGDSAGGGLAAGVVLLARDRDVPVARQILVYPMLDDRTTTPDPELAPFAAWSYDDNYTGWHALLGDAVGGPDVPYSAAPARATDVSDLPTTFIDTGELDIFRDECIDYARRIAATGTSVELHVHPGCPHGYDRMPIPVAQRAFADRIRVLQRL